MEILTVIVRYQIPPESSASVRGVQQAFAADPELRASVGALLWDNSEEPLPERGAPAGLEYHHSASNLGVSGACNESARWAADGGASWMLLLDQDTHLPPGYLQSMLAESRAWKERAEIAAIAPVVNVGHRIVSPRRSVFNGHRPYLEEDGVSKGEAFAINSGCLIRLSALRAVGGFSEDFWLDYSDRYLFHQFYLRGFRMVRAHVELQHEMTILDYDRLMSPWRYRNFVEAEGAFNDLFKSGLENAVQTLRLAVRVIVQRFRHRNPEFARITRGHLWMRLITPRRRRIDRWRVAQSARFMAR